MTHQPKQNDTIFFSRFLSLIFLNQGIFRERKMSKEKGKQKIHCGLCDVDVDNWPEHVKSKGHIKNLGNPLLMIERLGEYHDDLGRSMRGERFDND